MSKDFVKDFRIDSEANHRQDLIKNLERLVDKKNIGIIEIKKEYRRGFKEAFKDLHPLTKKTFVNIDSGLTITISGLNLRHSLHYEPSKIKTNIHSELENLIKSAVFLEKYKPNKPNDDKTLKAMYVFGNIAKVDKRIIVVQLIAKHYKVNDRIDHYNLRGLEIKAVDTYTIKGMRATGGKGDIPPLPDKISIIDLLKNVNIENKNCIGYENYYDFLEKEKNTI